jgi:CRISPR-associated exonuclease Cas4
MHEESFSREQKEIPIGDWGFADWIDFSHQTLHENKKSRAPRKAHQWQTLFYLAKLNLLGIPIKKAVIHELQHRQTKQIELTEELNAQIETMENEATHIINQPMPPPPVTIVACKKCSFEEFCYA